MDSTSSSVPASLLYAYACTVFTVAALTSLLLPARAPIATRAGSSTIKLLLASRMAVVTLYAAQVVLELLEDDSLAVNQARIFQFLVLMLTWSMLAGFQSIISLSCPITGAVSLGFELSLLVLSARNLDWTLQESTAFSIRLALITSFSTLLALSVHPSDRYAGQPLLGAREAEENEHGRKARTAYGTQGLYSKIDRGDSECEEDSDEGDEDEDEAEDAALIKRRRAQRLRESGGWFRYLQDFAMFAPYIVPKGDVKVQLSYLISLSCIIAGRALNVLIPRQLGYVADNLLNPEPPYRALFVWLLLSFARYQPGLDLIQALVKIPIEQFSYRCITNAAFEHVMSLSMDFHSERDSAEIIRAIEQGSALTNLLSTLVLEILPTFLDLGVAFVYLSSRFNISLAIALLVASVAFVGAEAIATNLNLDNRRKMAKTSRKEAKVIHQAVQGWQAVALFNRFGFEKFRFSQAVRDHLLAQKKWGVGDAFVQCFAEALIPLTFFVLACLVMHEISTGRATSGDFVFLMQYWESLTWPLSMLSHNCRYLMSDLIDAERLLYMFQTKPSIKDKENAVSLKDCRGHVGFENVDFCYDPHRTVLRDFSLEILPGQTVALVGETGAGKSSTVKLLLRLYDITAGRITVDGHDIRHLTLESLRSAIGIVPQTPTLFNGSILENLRYAKLDASDDEIRKVCRAAAIHDKIITFPKDYETIVGEAGVKLSGGEVQRLAIARVLLQDPTIVVLDEATSAIDSITEMVLQTALDVLKEGRTTLVVAHRLSTIVKADQIVVMHDGMIVEQGDHEQLLERGGRYYQMWIAQTSSV